MWSYALPCFNIPEPYRLAIFKTFLKQESLISKLHLICRSDFIWSTRSGVCARSHATARECSYLLVLHPVSTLWEQREGMLAGRKGLTFTPCCKLPEKCSGGSGVKSLNVLFPHPITTFLISPTALLFCSCYDNLQHYFAIHRLYAEIKRQTSSLGFNKLRPWVGKLHSVLITCTSGLVRCSNPSLVQYHPSAHT